MNIVIALLLLVIAILLGLIYTTTDSFNQDLKQLRQMANQIERHLAELNNKQKDTAAKQDKEQS